jgi:hypothetical protein
MPPRPIGGLGVGRACSPQAARLGHVFRGRNQLGDKIGARQSLVRYARPLNGRNDRHQRDAGGLFVRENAVIWRPFWSIVAWHRHSKSG